MTKKKPEDSKKQSANGSKDQSKELDVLRQETESLRQQVEALTQDLKRAQADYINFKRRADEERAASIAFGSKQLLVSLLPTLDNVHRALAHTPEELKENEWAKGVSKVAAGLEKQLSELGVEKIGIVGEDFDPEKHEAVAVSGEGNKEVVAEVLQTGFELNGDVIRHAMVKVENK